MRTAIVAAIMASVAVARADLATRQRSVRLAETFRTHADEIVCVLLDLTMPRVDGEEAFRELRRIRPDVTVVLCSGYNRQDATQRFAGKGLAGFIQKPYNTLELTKKLMEVLPQDQVPMT